MSAALWLHLAEGPHTMRDCGGEPQPETRLQAIARLRGIALVEKAAKEAAKRRGAKKG